MAPDICIYHGNCADGFGAAWAVWKRFGDAVEYLPGFYGAEPPDVAGKTVVMVDFSYKRPVLDELARTAANILILDHHKTAAADLAGLPQALPWELHIRAGHDDIAAYGGPRAAAIFDMERSGAQIAWDYFHGTYLGVASRRPGLINYVGDRDLWRFALEGSREVAAYVFSHPYDFAVWNTMECAILNDRQRVIAEGAAIERKHFKDIGELLAQTKRPMRIGGHEVLVANLPYTMSSDAAGMLAEGKPFGACYFDRNDGQRVFSLRSRESGIDVSEVAKAYGGGGHRNAAGFQAPAGWEGEAPPSTGARDEEGR